MNKIKNNRRALIQLYPIGDWEIGSKIQEVSRWYNSVNPKFEEVPQAFKT